MIHHPPQQTDYHEEDDGAPPAGTCIIQHVLEKLGLDTHPRLADHPSQCAVG